MSARSRWTSVRSQLGSSSTRDVTVSNTGTAALHINNVTISDGQFAITSGDISGTDLAAGASATVTLIFSPSAVGAQSGTMTITSNDPDEGTVNVSLSGTGTEAPKPDINVSPLSVDFGSVPLGSSSTRDVTVSNTGTAVLHINNITISDGEFAINSGDISGTDLAPGASSTVTIVFTPSAVVAQSGTMTVTSNDPDEGSVNVSLSGIGEEGPEILGLDVEPSPVDFGSVEVGATSPEQVVSIKNQSTHDIYIIGVTLTGADAGQFLIVSDGASGHWLHPNDCVTVTVEFKPTSTGGKSADLHITSNDHDIDVPLSGTGIQQNINVNPLSVDFGSVTLGSSFASNVTVSNTGTAVLHIINVTISDSQFAITSGDISGTDLAPGASSLVTIVFTPSAEGPQSGTMTITSNDPDEGTVNVSLSGIGEEGPESLGLEVEPSLIDFGSVAVGATSPEQAVSIKNIGTRDFYITGVTLIGDDAGQFLIVSDGASGHWLHPNDCVTITVAFKPTSTGDKSADLHISSSDRDADVCFAAQAPRP